MGVTNSKLEVWNDVLLLTVLRESKLPGKLFNMLPVIFGTFGIRSRRFGSLNDTATSHTAWQFGINGYQQAALVSAAMQVNAAKPRWRLKRFNEPVSTVCFKLTIVRLNCSPIDDIIYIDHIHKYTGCRTKSMVLGRLSWLTEVVNSRNKSRVV